jgi:hypothetical protein
MQTVSTDDLVTQVRETLEKNYPAAAIDPEDKSVAIFISRDKYFTKLLEKAFYKFLKEMGPYFGAEPSEEEEEETNKQKTYSELLDSAKKRDI